MGVEDGILIRSFSDGSLAVACLLCCRCRCLRRWAGGEVARRAFGAIAVMFCDMAMPILEWTLMSHFPRTLVLVSLILGLIFSR
jgi:hypothetical protein